MRKIKFIAWLWAILGLISVLLGTTFAWENLNQNAKNENIGEVDAEVILILHDKSVLPADLRLEDGGFLLYKKDENNNDTQIGGTYTTDANGEVSLKLPFGDYYFRQIIAPAGYKYDNDGVADIIDYPFTLSSEHVKNAKVVDAYNIPLTGSLTIKKFVKNKDDSELSADQLNQAFAFTITFSDNSSYSYKLNGQGDPIKINSGDTIYLKHNETANFMDIKLGVTYSVEEAATTNYATTSNGSSGNIVATESIATFTNIYDQSIDPYAPKVNLTITKKLDDESADQSADHDKEFDITIRFKDDLEHSYTKGGVTSSITREGTIKIKENEQIIFNNLDKNTQYEILEEDDPDDDYYALKNSFEGTLDSQDVSIEIHNVYRPRDTVGKLIIKKEIVDYQADRDSAAEFSFSINFGDNNTHKYSIDGGAETDYNNGDKITIKHNQTITFDNLQRKLHYTIDEDAAKNYTPEFSHIEGEIVPEQTNEKTIVFRNNRNQEPPTETHTITIKKVVVGKNNDDSDYNINITVDGITNSIVLKDGQSHTITVNKGSTYKIEEEDYSKTKKMNSSIENGAGRIVDDVEVIITNTYDDSDDTVNISGTKTWKNVDGVTLPDNIVINIKNGDVNAAVLTVKPDANGTWKYSADLPKYDNDHNEINYTIEEIVPAGFAVKYNGFDIENTYITPLEVVLPQIEKNVEGEGASKDKIFKFVLEPTDGKLLEDGTKQKNITITGSGKFDSVTFSYQEAGEYHYKLYELDDREKGWEFDKTVYNITVKVEKDENNKLSSKYTIDADGNTLASPRLFFMNRYNKEIVDGKVTITVRKIWDHKDNPVDSQPDSVLIHIYADGVKVLSQRITALDNWQRDFELAKYNNEGKEIVYTVNEDDITDYDKEINGYTIKNTYHKSSPSPTNMPKPDSTPTPTPSDPEKDKPQMPNTGANGFWIYQEGNAMLKPANILAFIASSILFIVLVIMRLKDKNGY